MVTVATRVNAERVYYNFQGKLPPIPMERDPAQRATWTLIAEAAGYRATGLGSREEALAELARRPADVVVFSDHDAEGYDAVGKQVEEGGLGNPALIMLPAAGYPGDARLLRDGGFRGYLVKPVAPADLREALEILRRTPRARWDDLFITRHWLAEARRGEVPGEPLDIIMADALGDRAPEER